MYPPRVHPPPPPRWYSPHRPHSQHAVDGMLATTPPAMRPRPRTYGPRTRSYYARSGSVPLINLVLAEAIAEARRPTKGNVPLVDLAVWPETRSALDSVPLSVPDQLSNRTAESRPEVETRPVRGQTEAGPGRGLAEVWPRPRPDGLGLGQTWTRPRPAGLGLV